MVFFSNYFGTSKFGCKSWWITKVTFFTPDNLLLTIRKTLNDFNKVEWIIRKLSYIFPSNKIITRMLK